MAQTVKIQIEARPYKRRQKIGFVQGLGLTLLLAVAAKYMAVLPFLNVMGQLVIAMILGMAWRAIFGVPAAIAEGISFSGKKLLRLGIILLGMRLNLGDIVQAGPSVLIIALIHITVTLFVVYGLASLFKVDSKLSMLTACGTAICGAAAVVAIAPQVEAGDEETAIGAAVVAILGTIFTLAYTLLYPVFGLTPEGYGVFSGSTLHEIAHVIAAAAPGGKEAVDLAVVVKLTRVAMLVPVALLVGAWVQRKRRGREAESADSVKRPDLPDALEDHYKNRGFRSIPIPWFILGFLLMSGVNTLGIVPQRLSAYLVAAAYLLIAMAMAGLGLGVDFAAFRRLGIRPFWAGLIGSLALSGLGWITVHLFGLA
ncbi:putative integral membrane protein (TIGR00698 family) [Fontibacillus phaseoli]|uniref:Putative integral membrane protein (TIGR00698 family) n=1 Tax=Fontibacillus phaseoli TaxID=1416533 RepID=A0A369B5D7_9BACL|nr:YeiH family protein [Fontibacillus phaseoli]RCX16722.1 putative integral membrane protein (TIGR00698 family) [Fontibacillus phaseoli]